MGIQNLVGQTLGQYELRELLGMGGMGAVYRGYQTSLHRYVAIKVLSVQLVEQPGAIERFNREAQTSAALEHPNIIHIHDYGTQRGISYLVMQLLSGGSLAERIEQRADTEKPLPSLGEVSDLLRQLASALDYAHSQGVIHRDIKPSNVMFDNHGNAYLVDFGIAKLSQATSGLTASGVVIGTFGYMAPEQWKAEELTASTDQYALAVMTYALVTGQMPFNAPTPAGIMHKHLNEMPTPIHARRPDVPEAVTRVIERALAKKQEDRFPTVTAFAQAFDKAIRGSTGETTGYFVSPVQRRSALRTASGVSAHAVTATQPFYKSRAAWAMLALISVMALVIAALVLGRGDQNPPEKPVTTLAAMAASDTPAATATTATMAGIVILSTPTAAPADTDTPQPTETPIPTATLTLPPTETPDLDATINALMALHFTETAASWTDTPSPTPTTAPTATPTPDLLATAEVLAAARMTATADAYTDTPSPTVAAATPTPLPKPTSGPTTGNLIDCTKYDLSILKIGLVTDVGQIDDKSFNQSAWEGVLAAEKCGATVNYIETKDAVDYASNIAEFAENDFDIIVTVGFALGVATEEAAALYPDVQFIGVDQFQGAAAANVVGLVFHYDQQGFLAGALAARLTQTNTIAAVLGTDQIPPIVAFKEGYEAGARYVNHDITLISTYHPGAIDQAFTDPEWGATTARQALDQNADVVFAAAGLTGNGALIEVANAVGAGGPPPYCIGVDIDQWGTVPEAHACLVSSAMNLIGVGVADIIIAHVDSTLEPGNFFGQAGLAPFHDFEDAVPAEVQTEIDAVAAGLIDGSISTGYGVAAAEPTAAPAASVNLGVVKVGVNAEYPPFEFVDESGNLIGFDIELLDAVARQAGFELEWVNTRWDGIFTALASGEFDAVCSAATITPEREEVIDFSNPYFNAGQMIVVRQLDANTIKDPADLTGLRVGVQAGTTGDIAASEIAGVDVVRYDEITLAFQALASGDVDAVVNDGPVNADIIAKNPELGVVQVGDPFTDELYGIAVQPNHPELLDAINASLATVIANGTYREIYIKWFDMEPPSRFMP